MTDSACTRRETLKTVALGAATLALPGSSLKADSTPRESHQATGVKIGEVTTDSAIVWMRLEIMAPAREAVRRALSILAMPQNAPTGLKAGWRSADIMWRIAGDTSTDFNHYTKRMTLGGVYASTLLVWLDDQSEGWAETAAFLDRRIDDVMRFEKFKAQWNGREHFSASRFLGRLRYPAR